MSCDKSTDVPAVARRSELERLVKEMREAERLEKEKYEQIVYQVINCFPADLECEETRKEFDDVELAFHEARKRCERNTAKFFDTIKVEQHNLVRGSIKGCCRGEWVVDELECFNIKKYKEDKSYYDIKKEYRQEEEETEEEEEDEVVYQVINCWANDEEDQETISFHQTPMGAEDEVERRLGLPNPKGYEMIKVEIHTEIAEDEWDIELIECIDLKNRK